MLWHASSKEGGGGAGRRISKADQEGESVKTASNGSIGGGDEEGGQEVEPRIGDEWGLQKGESVRS